MTMSVNTFLLVLAFVFLVLAAVNCPAPRFFSFGWAGVAMYALTLVLRL
jgi:hypothetical protein